MMLSYINQTYKLNGLSYNLQVNKDTTVAEVVYQITTKHKMSAPMTLYEIIKEELGKFICVTYF